MEEFDAGAYYSNGTPRHRDGIPTIIIDEEYLFNSNENFPDEVFHVISHEMEHYISDRVKGEDSYFLTEYSIIGEPATELGCLYNLFRGDSRRVEDNIFSFHRKTRVAYETAVMLLVCCNKAAGHDIEDIIRANRDNDYDYFCSIIPEDYIDKISLLYDDFFEGTCIGELGNVSAMVLYDAVEQFKNYMWENHDKYPEMSEEIESQMRDMFAGYETMVDEKEAVSGELGKYAVFSLDYLDQETMEKIKSEVMEEYDYFIPEDIEYCIFSELLNQSPEDLKTNTIMSIYSGYMRFFQGLELGKGNSQSELLVRDIFKDFLDLYSYEEGTPNSLRLSPKQECILWDKDTKRIICIRNGFELAPEDTFTVYFDDENLGYGPSMNLTGKNFEADEWEKMEGILLSQKGFRYVKESEIRDQIQSFKEALNAYIGFTNPEKLSDEAKEFLNIFYDKEYELSINQVRTDNTIGIKEVLKGALLSEDCVTTEDVQKADREEKERNETSKDEKAKERT